MNTDDFLEAVSQLLRMRFKAVKSGYKTSEAGRCRLQGFMHAGVFMNLVSTRELSHLIASVHLEVLGQTVSERKSTSENREKFDIRTLLNAQTIDYDIYDSPAFERIKANKQ